MIRKIILNRSVQSAGRYILMGITAVTRRKNGTNEISSGIAGFVFKFALRCLALLLPAKFGSVAKAFSQLLVCDFDGALVSFGKAGELKFPEIDMVLVSLARAELYCREYRFSRKLLELAYRLNPKNADAAYNLSFLFLVFKEESAAKELILEAIALNRKYAMAHHNLAARYDRDTWVPKALDLLGDPDLHLYDAYHYLGQLLVNAADLETGISMFGNAMKLQVELARKYPVPAYLFEMLCKLPGFDRNKPLRILSYEWITQIGHLGMIDALLKMQRLGMRPDCNWVLLAPQEKIANSDFLQCWSPHVTIINDPVLIDALFPYQRICGEQFNCYMAAQGEVMDWSDAAAQAFIEWDRKGLGPLISLPAQIEEFGRRTLADLGLPRDAWFVALHVRSGGYYGEGWSHTQKHRNAPLKSYLPAIKRIHAAGGWVIRMGDPSIAPLAKMPMTIDLTHSPHRSGRLDVYLWARARFFLGTTSGPTNAVISFHTPTLLVNCVSNYAQSWNSRVLFVLKPFWSKATGRFLQLREVFTPTFRAKMFNIRALAGEGIGAKANSAEDILSATEEMLGYLDAGELPSMQDAGVLENAGCDLWLWGNAHPSKRFFEKYRQQLIDLPRPA